MISWKDKSWWIEFCNKPTKRAEQALAVHCHYTLCLLLLRHNIVYSARLSEALSSGESLRKHQIHQNQL